MRASAWPGSKTGAVATAAAFAALLLVLVGLAVFWLYYARLSVHAERVESLRAQAGVAASSARQFLQHYEVSLPMLANDLAPAWSHGDVAAMNDRLRRYRQADGNVSAVYLFDKTGRMRASSEAVTLPSASPHMLDAVFRADFDKALSQPSLVIGRTRYGAMIKEWILPMRMRGGRSEDERFVLSAVISLRGQHGLWSGIAAQWGGEVGLVRNDGYLQYVRPMPADPREAFGTPVQQDVLALLRTSAQAETGTEHSDAQHLYVAHRVEGFGMLAYAAMPRAMLIAAWKDRVRVPVILYLITVAALLFAAMWAVRQQRNREKDRNAAEQVLLASQADLSRQTQLLEQSQRAARVGGWELDLTNSELYWTQETYRIHEKSPDDFKPTLERALSFFSDASRRQMNAVLDAARSKGDPWDIEVDLTTPSGRHLWIRSTGRGERHAGRVARLWGAYQDITDRREAEERIRHLAHYDGLTALANRNLFITHLTHAIERASRESSALAVLFMDLDRFKIINDAMGHDVGDKVLKLMAERFALAIRSSDLLARWGGDEFIVATEDVSHPDNTATLARRLLSAVEEPVVLQEGEYVLTASIGVATYPDDGADGATLIKNADIAMYRAKEQGKNRYEYFSAQLSEASVRRLTLETQLKRAIQEGGQFMLGYQPKLRLADQQVSGLEALVRWRHPERGLILPGEFVPQAEDSGLIDRIGAWVLREACSQAAQWQRSGSAAPGVAVNLSARELYSAGIIDEVRVALSESALPPQCLEIEITETGMMRNVEQVYEVLRALKDIGVRLTVDDFGTGYSSLTYMKRFPLDAVKIDRSFIRDIPDDPDDLAIARAVIAMAHSLRLKVVAEGVENAAQERHLREMGCDEIQGLLVSAPLLGDEVTAYVASLPERARRMTLLQ